MPTSTSTWVLASPLSPSANATEQVSDLRQALGDHANVVSTAHWPEFKTGTLSGLMTVTDNLSKFEPQAESILTKIVDTLRSLDPNRLSEHLYIDDTTPYEEYLLHDWKWDRGKYRVEGRPVTEVADNLTKDLQSLDSLHRRKVGDYNLAKGQLQTLQRKRLGNLATKDLSTVISPHDVNNDIADSDYLQQVYVAVPKNSVKTFNANYERLCSMIVPRSAVQIASDDEFTLFSVTIFKRVKDEFTQKAREEKYTVREFVYDREAIDKQEAALRELEKSERELWTDLVRLSRLNFSESFQIIVHLKALHAFVEAALRYGPPTQYFFAFVQPQPKYASKAILDMKSFFTPFTPRLKGNEKSSAAAAASQEEQQLVAEYQTLLEQEAFDFVLLEIPKVESLGDR